MERQNVCDWYNPKSLVVPVFASGYGCVLGGIPRSYYSHSGIAILKSERCLFGADWILWLCSWRFELHFVRSGSKSAHLLSRHCINLSSAPWTAEVRSLHVFEVPFDVTMLVGGTVMQTSV